MALLCESVVVDVLDMVTARPLLVKTNVRNVQVLHQAKYSVIAEETALFTIKVTDDDGHPLPNKEVFARHYSASRWHEPFGIDIAESSHAKAVNGDFVLFDDHFTEWQFPYVKVSTVQLLMCCVCTYLRMLGRHAESCVHRVVRQMIGWIILYYNPISLKHDGVDGFCQILPYCLFLTAIDETLKYIILIYMYYIRYVL